ncbi:MAG: hypothetical protein DRQ57_18910 [Gammaproteobacteria bacterium]|nr:MAG: hypothetical protein DRQ57_18910 [Gammaproteobacteria bacterium]
MSTSKEFNYSGKSYEAEVPDTLDLTDNAALAINGMCGTIDPDLDYLPYGIIHFKDKTPHMWHLGTADVGCVAKYAEALPFMRIMSGSKQYLEIEAGVKKSMLERVDDGLYWDRYDPRRPWRCSYNDSEARYGKGNEKEDFCIPSHAARMLRAVLSWRNVCTEPGLDDVAGSIIRGLRRIAIDRDDYSYYPEKGGWTEATCYPRSGWVNTDEAESEVAGPEGSILCYHGHQIYGAIQWYEASGDPVALELAARLTRYCMKPKFWGGIPDPDYNAKSTTWGKASDDSDNKAASEQIWHGKPDPAYTAGSEQGHWFSHFHNKATGLRGILAYAVAASDQRAMEFVRRAYEFTLTQGIPRLGWINCFPGAEVPFANSCEGCAIADITALAVRLSDAGVGDYWDDVDAIVRNHLIEQQVTRRDILERIASVNDRGDCCNELAEGQVCWDNVIERSLGSYFCTTKTNSVTDPHLWGMVCCTGNTPQALYYAWEGIVREQGDTAQVNLFLNRAAKLLDVDSYLPYEGKVILRNKAARRISVRIPYWVERKEIRANVAGNSVTLDWLGNNLVFEKLKPDDVITLTFPVKETTSSYTINANSDKEQVITCTFRGGTCVDISPRDEAETSYPLYQRDHMKKDKAPMKTKTRFVADQTVFNW